MGEEIYGIDKDHAHPRAIELVPEDFFWSCIDELAPFGSDEGDIALAEYRDWKKEHPNQPSYSCLKWIIEELSEKGIKDYNEKILDSTLIRSQIEDKDFDDHYYLFVVDASVISTGFGQLVDEGEIDAINKPIIQLAIRRQKIWAELSDWGYGEEYINNLQVLERVLEVA
ncbi:MAG: molybdate metabolism regulator [Saprospiraceae bacterium]